MSKILSFLLKIRKHRPALGALPSDPHSSPFSLTDIDYPYCKLWRHTLCMSFWSHLWYGKFGKGWTPTLFL